MQLTHEDFKRFHYRVSHRVALLHVAGCQACFRMLREVLFELADEMRVGPTLTEGIAKNLAERLPQSQVYLSAGSFADATADIVLETNIDKCGF